MKENRLVYDNDIQWDRIKYQIDFFKETDIKENTAVNFKKKLINVYHSHKYE